MEFNLKENLPKYRNDCCLPLDPGRFTTFAQPIKVQTAIHYPWKWVESRSRQICADENDLLSPPDSSPFVPLLPKKDAGQRTMLISGERGVEL